MPCFYPNGYVWLEDGRTITRVEYEQEVAQNWEHYQRTTEAWLPRLNAVYKNAAGYGLGGDVLHGRERLTLKQAVQLLNDMGIMLVDGFREIRAEDFPKHS